MRTLEEINEKLYKNMSRLHRYEEFMDDKKCAAVRKNIFEEYQKDIELYKEERKLQREKSLFEVKSLTKSLKPFSFFGLIRRKTGKRAQGELSVLEEAYCASYELSRSVYEAITPEVTVIVDAAEDEDAAAEPEAEETPTEATAENAAAEPKEPPDEEVIIDDEEEEEENTPEGAEQLKIEMTEEDKEAKENGEVHQSGKSE